MMLPEWFISWVQTPLIVTAAIAVLALVWKASGWKTTVDTFIKDIGNKVGEIGKKVDKLLKRLPEPTTASESPRKLTEFGAKISREINGYDWAERTARELISGRVKDKEPYQVEELSVQTVEQSLDADPALKSSVLTTAYENGISKKEVLHVLEVELRDELLRLLNQGPTTTD